MHGPLSRGLQGIFKPLAPSPFSSVTPASDQFLRLVGAHHLGSPIHRTACPPRAGVFPRRIPAHVSHAVQRAANGSSSTAAVLAAPWHPSEPQGPATNRRAFPVGPSTASPFKGFSVEFLPRYRQLHARGRYLGPSTGRSYARTDRPLLEIPRGTNLDCTHDRWSATFDCYGFARASAKQEFLVTPSGLRGVRFGYFDARQETPVGLAGRSMIAS